jgi:hypothetical protein
MRASGAVPMAPAASSAAISRAAAPSLSGEALPAVIVPSGRKAGFSPASAAAVESARMDSSRSSEVLGTEKVRAS